MSNTTALGFKEKLQLRVAELTKRHTELLAEKEQVDKEGFELEKLPANTVGDKLHFSNQLQFILSQSTSLSATAAAVWDLKCEVEKCLSLYEVEHDALSYDIEKTGNFISLCIESCINNAQLETAEKLIDGLTIIYKPTTQLIGWVDSLKLQLHNKKLVTFS